MNNGIRFDWLTFDEWYGSKPEFLAALEDLGQLYVCEVPANCPCFPTRPKYKSLQRPFVSKRIDSACKYSKPFKGKPWKKIKLARKTLGDQVWEVRAAQVLLARDGKPTDRTYWLIVARSVASGQIKYFVSNAPPRTALLTLMKVAFTRWGVEHAFRLAKTAIGFGHFEGRSYKGLMRHMTLCQLVLLFAAEQTDRLRGKNPEVTIEQTARAMNTLCRGWLERRSKRSRVEHVSWVIEYHQTRNKAARMSRQRTIMKTRVAL